MIVFKVTFSSYVLLFVKMSGLLSLSFSKACQMFFCIPPTVASSSSSSSASCCVSAQPGFLWLPPPLLAPFCLQKEVSGLDNGVPIKIILDVISWHAMHLEVSGRYHVLLVHLCMVSCHCGPCVAHGGHVGISWRTHHGHALSGVHVEISCVEVLAGFVGVHGAMTNRRLHRPLWLDYTGAGKKLVDGWAEVCDLGRFQGPIVQLRLSHTLS